jgi:propanediol dehydratase small subunit
MTATVRTRSGRSLDDLTMDALRADQLTPEDFRISRETLDHQADAAASAGYTQQADNLRRAAEMTALSHTQVLEIYNMLRPSRSTYVELVSLADRLHSEMDMPRLAAFIREAAEVYRERGIVKNA